MARCLVVQHAAPETPGAIAGALEAAGVELDVRRVFAGDELPEDSGGHDGLVFMGGPMSAHRDEGFPTRRRELELLRHALEHGRPILGVCLGAQLLALADGGDVYPGEAGPEIGWGPVTLNEEAASDPLFSDLAPELTVLHWHGDTFRLGPRATLLAASPSYAAQAFRSGSAAWGLQFHLEVDAAQVAGFVAAFPDDAARAPGGAPAIERSTAAALAKLAPVAARVCRRFAALVAGRSRLGRPGVV